MLTRRTRASASSRCASRWIQIWSSPDMPTSTLGVPSCREFGASQRDFSAGTRTSLMLTHSAS